MELAEKRRRAGCLCRLKMMRMRSGCGTESAIARQKSGKNNQLLQQEFARQRREKRVLRLCVRRRDLVARQRRCFRIKLRQVRRRQVEQSELLSAAAHVPSPLLLGPGRARAAAAPLRFESQLFCGNGWNFFGAHTCFTGQRKANKDFIEELAMIFNCDNMTHLLTVLI